MMPFIVTLNTHSVTLNTHSVILNAHSVILNAVKNLEVSVAVNGSASLEILRFTQDDTLREIPTVAMLPRNDGG